MQTRMNFYISGLLFVRFFKRIELWKVCTMTRKALLGRWGRLLRGHLSVRGRRGGAGDEHGGAGRRRRAAARRLPRPAGDARRGVAPLLLRARILRLRLWRAPGRPPAHWTLVPGPRQLPRQHYQGAPATTEQMTDCLTRRYTWQVIFYALNAGETQGAVGIDDIRLSFPNRKVGRENSDFCWSGSKRINKAILTQTHWYKYLDVYFISKKG